MSLEEIELDSSFFHSVVPTPTPEPTLAPTPAPTVEPTKAPVTPSMAPVSEEVSTSVSNEVNTVVEDITKGNTYLYKNLTAGTYYRLAIRPYKIVNGKYILANTYTALTTCRKPALVSGIKATYTTKYIKTKS